MEAFAKKVKDVLVAEFPKATVDLDVVKPSKKIGGLMVWEGFKGIEQIKRQTKLWKVLRHRLTPEEQLRITAILTVTPQEREVCQEA